MKSSFLTLPREFSRSIRMENSTRFGSGVMLPDSNWTGKNRYLSPRKGFRIHIEVLPLFASHTGHQDILHLNVRVKFRLVAQSPLYRTIQHVPFPALLELYVSIRLHRSFCSAGAIFCSESEMVIDGTTVYTNNSAGLSGGKGEGMARLGR